MSTESTLPWLRQKRDDPSSSSYEINTYEHVANPINELFKKTEPLAVLLALPNNRDKATMFAIPFAYGAGSAVSSLYIGNRLATEFGYNFAAIRTMAFGNFAFSGFTCLALSLAAVTTPILARGLDICPVCLDMRQTAIGIGTGVLLPCLASPFAVLSYGHMLGKHHVPSVSNLKLSSILQTYGPLAKRAWSRPVPLISLAYLLLSPFAVWLQSKAHARIMFDLEEDPETMAIIEENLNSFDKPSRLTLWGKKVWASIKEKFA